MKRHDVWLTALVLVVGAFALRADEFVSNGVKIHYEISGQGEPVILIHGLYSSARMNWDLPGVTAQLAKHFQVIALDNRGHGQSDKPQREDQYGAEMAEDIVRLMDHLQIKKARVVGYSLGGMIVMKLLTLHPDRVTLAVLGGMGWLKDGGALQRYWEILPSRGRSPVPPACLHGMAKLAVTAEQVKAVRVPVTIIAGDRDPCQRLYIDPLLRIRPDWPEHTVKNAGHVTCIVKQEFKDDLEKALQQPHDGTLPPANR
jgi:pimeloyl-ACP methyl ester carboxylesterase